MTGRTSTPGIQARDGCTSFGSHLVLDKVNLTPSATEFRRTR
jgi:hypothetical protein